MTGAAAYCSRILLCSAALLLLARPAAAEWLFTPFFGWEFAGNTSLADFENASDDMHRSFGVTVTHLGRGPLGFEGHALYIPGFFNDPKLHGQQDIITTSRAYALMGNLVLAAPLRWNEYGLRPYLSGGLGLLRAYARVDTSDLVWVDQSLLGADVGGGAVGFITDHTGLRFDLRFHTNLRDSKGLQGDTVGARTHLRYWSLAIGLVLK